MSKVRCKCGKQFVAKPELAGKRFKCPGCGAVVAIPKQVASQAVGGSAGAATQDDDPLGLGDFANEEMSAPNTAVQPPAFNPPRGTPTQVIGSGAIAPQPTQSKGGTTPPANGQDSREMIGKAVKLVFIATIIQMLSVLTYAAVPLTAAIGVDVGFLISGFATLIRTTYVGMFLFALIICLRSATESRSRMLVSAGIGLSVVSVLFDWVESVLFMTLSTEASLSAVGVIGLPLLAIVSSVASQCGLLCFLFFLQSVGKQYGASNIENESKFLAYSLIVLIAAGVLIQVGMTAFAATTIQRVEAQQESLDRILEGDLSQVDVESLTPPKPSVGSTLFAMFVGFFGLLMFIVQLAWLVKYLIFLHQFDLRSTQSASSRYVGSWS